MSATPHSLRRYQRRIVNNASEKNTLVVLPTGAGKTAIAAKIMLNTIQEHKGSKGLFLVPTVLLVKQQAKALREWCGDEVLKIGEFKGGMDLPADTAWDILVSTPKAFLMKQKMQFH